MSKYKVTIVHESGLSETAVKQMFEDMYGNEIITVERIQE